MKRAAALLLAALGALLGAALLLAGPASAHATLVSSNPGDGDRLQHAPSQVTVTFDEGVGLGSLSYLNVIDSNGKRVDTGPVTHPGGNPKQIGVHLQPGLKDGTYTESYRVISADSHPVAGVIRFVVGNGPLVNTPAAGSNGDTGVAALFDAVRWVSYAGIALLGGVWLVLTVFPSGRDDSRARAVVWSGWAAAVLGTLFELVLQGAYVAGRPVGSAFDSAVIDATLRTTYGVMHSYRFALLGGIALLLGLALQPGKQPKPWDHLFWPMAVGVAYTFSATGHASTTNPSWLSIALDMLHLLAMCAWVGGLVMLVAVILPRRDPDEYAETLPAFSRIAATSVAVLATTGTYAAWRGIGSWSAIVRTEYGLLVLGKVVLFAGLLALGNLSRVMIQRRVRRPVVAFALEDEALAEDEPPAGAPVTDGDAADEPDEPQPPTMTPVHIERMRRSVLVEVALAAIVLALTAVLVTQPRGAEALAAQVPSQVTATAPITGHESALVTVTPGEHGPVAVRVALQGGTAKNVAATATQQSAQVGPLPIRLKQASPGVWSAGSVTLPVGGEWTITLVVGSSRFNAVTTDAKVDLK